MNGEPPTHYHLISTHLCPIFTVLDVRSQGQPIMKLKIIKKTDVNKLYKLNNII